MGTKEKRRSRSRSRSPSSDSSPERKHKKEKKHSKHKHKHKKHKKHSSPDVDDEKLRAAKAFLEQHLKQAGGGDTAAAAAAAGGSKDRDKERSKEKKEKAAGSLPPGVPLLTPDDYFERAAEFTAWLQEIKHQYFNELTTEESHAMFKQFAEAWNLGRLPLRFYQGLAAAPLKRTTHNWGIKARPSGAGAAGGSVSAAAGAKLGMAAFLQDQKQQHTESRVAARAGEAADRRSWRREQKEALDDLLPKATGGSHEARVEARMARREAARARDGSPDLVPVTGGGDMMGGGGDDSFAAAKAREAKRQEWRSRQSAAKKEELAGKLSAAAAAEADKMAQFRALVAAQGGRISIAKRQ
ncbi:hypothetical protein OEZ86_011246 [Tetradesmus obliquus]|nr:hypothetical protein OEZ86_011246 [Tetradesmus obliquus]